MSKASKQVQAFIAMNTTAYTAAAKVFKEIEAASDRWAETLAKAGIMGADIKPFAVAYVSEITGVAPYPSRKGGELIFEKDSKEHNRVRYLVDTATGAAAQKATKRGATKSSKTDPVAELLEAYKALTAAQKRAFKAAI
jgi:hypothetical protein